MTFTAENFEDLLNFYKDNCKIQNNAKDVYQTLTEISKSDNDDSKPIIENDSIFLFNLDNLCYNSYLSKSGHISKDLPSSVDALYFSNTMFLIEFKGEYVYYPDNRRKLKEIIDLFENDEKYAVVSNELINLLKDIHDRYEDRVLSQLKTKPIESIFLVLPKLYEYYCDKKKIKCDKVEFMSWLFNISKRIIIVFLDDEFESEKGKSKSYKYLRRNNSLKTKYKPLVGLVNAHNSIITKSEFEELYLDKFSNS